MKKAILFMLLVFALGGLVQAKTKNVKLNREFALGAKDKAVVKTDKLNVEFVKVLEDSRCPVGVDCVWAGNAKIQIKISKGKAAAQLFEINTSLDPKTINFQGYRIEFINLDPAPRADTEMTKRNYTAKFIVRK